MKKIILTAAVLITYLSAGAQNYTERWPNGNKKVEGTTIGKIEESAGASKADLLAESKNAVRDGKWTTWYEDGAVQSEAHYDKGAMTGIWKSFYNNGRKESEIDYNKGTAVNYWQNGTKSSEGGMKAGMEHTGRWTGYYDTGVKNYEGAYNDAGQKEGTWVWYNEAGVAVTEQQYSNGALVNSTDLGKK